MIFPVWQPHEDYLQIGIQVYPNWNNKKYLEAVSAFQSLLFYEPGNAMALKYIELSRKEMSKIHTELNLHMLLLIVIEQKEPVFQSYQIYLTISSFSIHILFLHPLQSFAKILHR